MTVVWERQRETERERESRELFSWLCLPTLEKSPWEGNRTRASLLTGLNSPLPLSTHRQTDSVLERQSPVLSISPRFVQSGLTSNITMCSDLQ